MQTGDAEFAPVRFSTAALPARERVPICREVIARQMMRVDMEPLPNRPFEVAMTVRRLPDLRVGTLSSPGLRVTRPPELMADNDDSFCLLIELGDRSLASLKRRHVRLGSGDAVLMHSMDPCVSTHLDAHMVAAAVPRTALDPLVADIEDATMQLIPAGNEALRLLPTYLRAAYEELPLASPEIRQLVQTHVHDLMALVIGATRDGTALAKSRGLRAARLRQILAEIRTGFANPLFSAARVAARCGLSTRYVQDLLQETGHSFTERVLELRLQKARAMLASSAHRATKVSEIAYACGFNEVSYFNRCFRRRFGASPTQYRGENGSTAD